MGLGVDAPPAARRARDQAVQALVEQAGGALARRQVPDRALEEVGAGVLHAAVSAPAIGWPPTKRWSSIAAPRARALVEPTSVTTQSARRGRRAPPRTWPAARPPARRQSRPRRRRAPPRASPRPRSMAPQLAGRRQPLGAAAEAHHLGAAPRARAGREADRAADQPDAEDGDPHPVAPRPHRSGEPVEHLRGRVPVHAGVGDRLAVGERRVAARSWRPATRNDSSITPTIARCRRASCAATSVRDRGLAGVVLAAVVVRGVDHHALGQAGARAASRARPRRPRRRRSSARRGRRAGSRGSRGCRVV